MRTRKITVTVTYDIDNIPQEELTNTEIAKRHIEKDMNDIFWWDEGFKNLTVEVVDED